MKGISKKFGDFYALDGVDFSLKKGEIHALLGENGAGKSTLMSVLFGLYNQDAGDIYINGKKENIDNPTAAGALGIGMVHQHFKLVHNFTVLESIVLGHESVKNAVLEFKNPRARIKKLCSDYGFDVDPDAIISNITVGQQQKVEILKMLYTGNDILIFDEPTAVLTPQEIEDLMLVMEHMKKEGKSMIFISHKLDEIKRISDRCTVLRKGKMIGTVDTAHVNKEQLSEMMVGRKVNLEVKKSDIKPGENILEVKNLTVKNPIGKVKDIVRDVSFEVKAGQIVTIAGIDGNGQSELVYALTGLMDIKSGSIIIKGKDVTNESIRTRNRLGLSHIPEDRHKYGLVLDFSLEYNLALKRYYSGEFQKKGFLNFAKITDYANYLIDKYDIRSADGAKSTARGMSGGNQQKAIIARELDMDPDLVIAVQPVRGLDVGAIEYIHSQIASERDKGKAVLLVSFELDEVFSLSDIIIVIHDGEIVAKLDPKTTTRQELGLYMAGAKKEVC